MSARLTVASESTGMTVVETLELQVEERVFYPLRKHQLRSEEGGGRRANLQCGTADSETISRVTMTASFFVAPPSQSDWARTWAPETSVLASFVFPRRQKSYSAEESYELGR